MEMWLIVIYSFLSYSCKGSFVNQSTQSSVYAERKGKDITDIKIDVDVMKGNYHNLLLRVIKNEDEIAFLKGQTQQLEHELENTKRTFSCGIEGLRDGIIQFEQELNETTSAWNVFNETIQDLSQRVSVLDSKYSPLEIPGKHSDEAGLREGKLDCPLGWVRRVDFGACYFVSQERSTWGDAQMQCRKQNGSLVDIQSENEAVWLADYARSNTARVLWIGGQKDHHGIYKWVTSDGKNKHMNYTQWYKGVPLYQSNRSQCVLSLESYQYKWRLANCMYFTTFLCKTYI